MLITESRITVFSPHSCHLKTGNVSLFCYVFFLTISGHVNQIYFQIKIPLHGLAMFAQLIVEVS